MTFGENLLKAYAEWQALPAEHRGETRGLRTMDLALTDKEIFVSLPRGDLWLDSRIHEVFLYLCGSKHCVNLGCIFDSVWGLDGNGNGLHGCLRTIVSTGYQKAGPRSWMTLKTRSWSMPLSCPRLEHCLLKAPATKPVVRPCTLQSPGLWCS